MTKKLEKKKQYKETIMSLLFHQKDKQTLGDNFMLACMKNQPLEDDYNSDYVSYPYKLIYCEIMAKILFSRVDVTKM